MGCSPLRERRVVDPGTLAVEIEGKVDKPTKRPLADINRLNVRSFIANLANEAKVKAGSSTLVKGIALAAARASGT